MLITRYGRVLTVACVVLGTGQLALAGDDGTAACKEGKEGLVPQHAAAGFDPGSGRDIRAFPPHRVADIQHMKLEIMIPDMNTARLSASQTLTMTPISHALETLRLDAQAMTIESVTAAGHQVSYTYDNRALKVEFTPPVGLSETVNLVTSYQLEEPPLGLIWTPESPAWPGRSAQIHTQGEPETNSYWFPCHDFPNTKLTTELKVTVPAGYTVSSNGHLASQNHSILTSDSPGGSRSMKPYDTFHWVQDKPHSAYLVTMVVGKFDIVDVGTRALPMPVYAPLRRGQDVKATFGRTKDMVALFERLTGQPYAWDRYAQLVVWNFGSGGMENTSATTLYDTAILEPSALVDHDMDGLISHELAHQWFGDLATCNSWEHIWLNEGFATYMTALWMEHRDGEDAYQANIMGNFDSLIAGDKADAPAAVGMCSKAYAHPWEVFRKPANPYSKGSSVLHMLRQSLGDDDFFKGVALYLERRKFKTAETSDLRTAFEEVSGRNLEKFFYQWCTRPGLPLLTIAPAWNEGTHELTVIVQQTQTIDGDNPAFEFNLPVTIGARADGGWHLTSFTIPVSAQSTTYNRKLGDTPAYVAVDPDMTVLAQLMVNQPIERWTTQLVEGPTLYSRVQACRALRAGTKDAGAEALRRTAMDKKNSPTLRVEAIKALAARGDDSSVRLIAGARLDSWEARGAVAEALATLATSDKLKANSALRDTAASMLAERATSDQSVKVRAAAIRALGKIKSGNAAGIATAALNQNSQNDVLRQAGLDALADLNAPDALPLAIVCSSLSNDTRTRPVAVTTIGKLASQDKDTAFRALATLLNDPQLRTQRAAGQALVDLGDERGIVEFEKAAGATKSEEIRQQMRDWAKALKEKKG